LVPWCFPLPILLIPSFVQIPFRISIKLCVTLSQSFHRCQQLSRAPPNGAGGKMVGKMLRKMVGKIEEGFSRGGAEFAALAVNIC